MYSSFKGKYFLYKFFLLVYFLFPGSPVPLSHDGEGEDSDKLVKLMEEYRKYKENFTKNLLFDSSLANLSESRDVYV